MTVLIFKGLVMVHFGCIGLFPVRSIELVSLTILLQLIAFILMFLLVLFCTATLFDRLILPCTLVFLLNFTSINMVRVHYSLFGDWYAVDLPDMSTARAFACDFLEFWFEVL